MDNIILKVCDALKDLQPERISIQDGVLEFNYYDQNSWKDIPYLNIRFWDIFVNYELYLDSCIIGSIYNTEDQTYIEEIVALVKIFKGYING